MNLKNNVLEWIEAKLQLEQNLYEPHMYTNPNGNIFIVIGHDDENYFEIYNSQTHKEAKIPFKFIDMTVNEAVRVTVNKLMEVQ